MVLFIIDVENCDYVTNINNAYFHYDPSRPKLYHWGSDGDRLAKNVSGRDDVHTGHQNSPMEFPVIATGSS